MLTASALSSGQIRSFISIDLGDEKILSRVESITSSLLSLGGDLKLVERENIHLTLKFLGNVSASKLGEIKSGLTQVAFLPFSLEIKGAGAFPNLKRMNVIWVGVGEGWSEVELIFEQTEKLLHQLGVVARENLATSFRENRSKQPRARENGPAIAGYSK